MSAAEPGAGAGLWSFAQTVHAAPGVEAASLRLQDQGGQCVALLFWGLWCARTGHGAKPRTLAAAVDLARRWEGSVNGPLRAARRALRAPLDGIADTERLGLRARVAAVALDGERVLLGALEALTPPGAVIGADPLETLRALAGLWGGTPAQGDLVLIADAVHGHGRGHAPRGEAAGNAIGIAPGEALPGDAEVLNIGGESGRGQPPMHDDDPSGGDGSGGDDAGAEGEAAIRRKLGELRQAHQDLDAAVAALEAGAQPDQLQIARLKKKKLILRDQISKLDNRLTPDIIA